MRRYVFTGSLLRLTGFSLLLAVSKAWADAPVVNLSQSLAASSPTMAAAPLDDVTGKTQNTAPTTALPVPRISNDPISLMALQQAVGRLQQQMDSRQQINLLEQIQALQTQVQALRGELQLQGHQLELLRQQPTINATQLSKKSHNPLLLQNPQTVASDKLAYETAYGFIQTQQYPRARTAFDNFIQQYPKSVYLSNAYYWLGELDLRGKNYDAAQESFQHVITQFPHSPKIADAKLKLGYVYVAAGKVSKAKTQFQQVIDTYPNTGVARLAALQLKKIQ